MNQSVKDRVEFIRAQLRPLLRQASDDGIRRAELIMAICASDCWKDEGVSMAVVKDGRTDVADMTSIACVLVDCVDEQRAVMVAEATAAWLIDGMLVDKEEVAPDPETLS